MSFQCNNTTTCRSNNNLKIKCSFKFHSTHSYIIQFFRSPLRVTRDGGSRGLSSSGNEELRKKRGPGQNVLGFPKKGKEEGAAIFSWTLVYFFILISFLFTVLFNVCMLPNSQGTLGKGGNGKVPFVLLAPWYLWPPGPGPGLFIR